MPERMVARIMLENGTRAGESDANELKNAITL